MNPHSYGLHEQRLRCARRGLNALAAQQELLALYQQELAALLAWAAWSKLAQSPRAVLCGLEEGTRCDARTWAARVRHLLACLRADGMELPDAQLLCTCLGQPSWQWAEARELATAALMSKDDIEGRLCLALACMLEGRTREALETFQSLFAADAWRTGSSGWRWRALTGLAELHEARGSDRLALGACLGAVSERDCGPWAPALGVVLALATGDRLRAQAMADRLRSLERTGRSAWPLALHRLTLRVAALRGALPWVPPHENRDLLQSWRREEGTPASELCAALFCAPRSATRGGIPCPAT